jgi:hypothetical protein
MVRGFGPWVPDVWLIHGQARGQARNSGMTAKAARGTICKGMADYMVIQALALIALLLFPADRPVAAECGALNRPAGVG